MVAVVEVDEEEEEVEVELEGETTHVTLVDSLDTLVEIVLVAEEQVAGEAVRTEEEREALGEGGEEEDGERTRRKLFGTMLVLTREDEVVVPEVDGTQAGEVGHILAGPCTATAAGGVMEEVVGEECLGVTPDRPRLTILTTVTSPST